MSTVLVLGGDAANPGIVDHALATAWRMGFDEVASRSATASDVDGVAPGTRTADTRPWLVAGTAPAGGMGDAGDRDVAVIVFYDALPHEPDRDQHAGVDNVRVARLYDRLRRSLPRRAGAGGWSVAVSMTSAAADNVVRNLFDARVRDDLIERATASASFRDPPGVLRPLSVLGERARVDLVDLAGRAAVRKTFRPGRGRYLERELFVMQELRAHIPAVAELLDVGPDHLVMPVYDDVLGIDPERLQVARRLVPLPVAEAMVDVVRAFHGLGYAVIDCHPGHFLVDAHGRVRIIDFEFLHRYDHRPPLEECFEFAGAPEHLDERDVPVPAWMYVSSAYDWCWRPHLGFSPRAATSPARWPRWAERAGYGTRRTAGRVTRGVGRRLRSATSVFDQRARTVRASR